MKEIWEHLIGTGKELSFGQMGIRSLLVFFACLLLIRISGRRSFSWKSPMDTVISIILGAVISRTIVGASPFFPTLGACLVIVILHRFMATVQTWMNLWHPAKGAPLLLFEDGRYLKENLRKATLSQQDIQSKARQVLGKEDLSGVVRIYMEKSGELSFIIKKE